MGRRAEPLYVENTGISGFFERLNNMIVCLGPFCVPIWQIGLIALAFLRPIWLFLVSFVRLPVANAGEQGDEPQYHVGKGTYEGNLATIRDWDRVVALARQANRFLVVKYSAEFCGPCKRIAPRFRALADQLQCVFCDIDVENSNVLDLCADIKVLPTFRVYDTTNGRLTLLKTVQQADLVPLVQFIKKTK